MQPDRQLPSNLPRFLQQQYCSHALFLPPNLDILLLPALTPLCSLLSLSLLAGA